MAESLSALSDYLTDATFEVLLPSAENPIVYDLTLQSDLAAAPDSLAPCDYVIRWNAITPSGPLSGFSAYFDGNHYRYRNNRLQEYHYADNPSVFTPEGTQGVQMQAQFADLLPQFLAIRLNEIATDTAFEYTFHPDTLINKRRAIAIDGIKRVHGYDSQYFTYTFDYDSKLPLSIDLETSPGTISEQIITVTYKPSTDAKHISYTEDALMAEWPEVFEKYRESTFRAESLTGQPLPNFSCQLLGSDLRLEHQRGEALQRPALLVFLDPDVNSTAATIADVRQGASMLPGTIDIVWAFKSNHEAEIEELLGQLPPEEKALTSVGSLIRNCGVNLYPTLFFISADGTIKDVVIAYNQTLPEIVIEKALTL
ncbi:MAG: hypothetical protein LIP09_13565 [Bacteroidales bacterium]|nr:hypothetical protein [Bacteroidales bacterium]